MKTVVKCLICDEVVRSVDANEASCTCGNVVFTENVDGSIIIKGFDSGTAVIEKES